MITGGVDGLGGLIAETYGMRGLNVAVLDNKKVDDEEAEEKGVLYYQCDVGDEKQVEAAVAEIVEDVPFSEPTFTYTITDWNSSVLRPFLSTTLVLYAPNRS